jgi:hypothetical protein
MDTGKRIIKHGPKDSDNYVDTARRLSVYDGKNLGDKSCWYCGEYLFERMKTKDHFWPKKLNGRLTVSCCRNCNGLKSHMTPLAFITFLQELKALNPYKQNLYPKFDRMIHATQTLWDRVKWSVNK